MDETGTGGKLSDEDMRTEMGGGMRAEQTMPRDMDGTDTQDDQDGTDKQDEDATDEQDQQDGTDSKDMDGTDTKDADGTDQ